MLIQCTKKLLDRLKIKSVPDEPVTENPLFSWHANVLSINRKNIVILVNDSNRYVIVLYGLLANDFKKLDEIIQNALRKVFQNEGISSDIIEKYIEQAQDISYTKTKDRKSVARMNISIEPIHFLGDVIDPNEKIQLAASYRLSRILVTHGTDEYINPNEELMKDLEIFSGKQVIQTKAVQIKVSLELEDINVWRRLTIPLNTTFRKFHNMLQIAFDWQNSHLYEFYIFDEKTNVIKDDTVNIFHPSYHHEGKKPIMNIVASEEAFEYGDHIPMKLDTNIMLSNYLPNYKSLKYIYDFGDDWRHNIEVEEVIDTYDKNYAICLDGEGDSPPEDVGGMPGYKMFMEIISDPSHPEYNEMLSWGKMQGYTPFDIEYINIGLKSY